MTGTPNQVNQRIPLGPLDARGQDLYGGEEVGGLECAGIFTAYERSVYENLTVTTIEKMLQRVTER